MSTPAICATCGGIYIRNHDVAAYTAGAGHYAARGHWPTFERYADDDDWGN